MELPSYNWCGFASQPCDLRSPKHTHTHTRHTNPVERENKPFSGWLRIEFFKGGQAVLNVSNKQTHLVRPPPPLLLLVQPSTHPYCPAEWLLWIINCSGYWRRKALKWREKADKGSCVKRPSAVELLPHFSVFAISVTVTDSLWRHMHLNTAQVLTHLCAYPYDTATYGHVWVT